ncbi:nuclear transport factor 2 family protein [Arthrobacter sp. SLBN-53]|uniref:nuclear transport factor 2 family protein n=1 Tax=Arthrobacter sp. SLBN-53 TaxID=2768412 RepID=UPI00114F52C1|nr:nuclear transport factor 2 family protein [Arthrobacter sp. SLBN-53]TQK32125.1 SnoaL-like protein [Arthrobacter sp. SLBN-53]
MNAHERLQALIDKDEIRELALRYCRGVDRKDPALLRSLYTNDGIDNHANIFRGSASAYVDFLESSFQFIQIGARYVCNHLIELDGDEASGEVYALGYHILPIADSRPIESFVGVRYLDRYRREDGQWRFASREVVIDLDRSRTVEHRGAKPMDPEEDLSYRVLAGEHFQRRSTNPVPD